MIKEIGREYPQADEQAIIEEFVREMEAQVDELYANQQMRRQVHTKMHGCVQAKFSVNKDLAEELQVGVFQAGTSYDAWLRFSNANTRPSKDGAKDIRGLAIKLLNVPGEKILEGYQQETTQDFLLMSSETFFSKNIEEFRGIMRALTSKSKLNLVGFLLNPKHWPIIPRLMKVMIKCDNPLNTNYWSTQPYRFGAENKAVKYFLKPSSSNELINENTSDDDYLRQNLAQTLLSGACSFDFYIQFQENADTMPIEDPTVPWTSKMQHIGTLEIPQQQCDTPELRKFGENLSFNPWHTLPEHKPLGGFNRARKAAYIALSKYRHEKNQVNMFEPTTLTPVE